MAKLEKCCLIVVDSDRKVFSVHGPMLDDTDWTDAVCRAQQQGRDINCHSSVPGLTASEVASSYGSRFPAYGQVANALSL